MFRLRMGVFAVCALAAACEDEPRAIDPFPVQLAPGDGPLVAAASARPETSPVPAVVDILSPVTVLDSFRPGSELPEPGRRRLTLTLFGLDEAGEPTVPRARFPDTAVFDIHPCGASEELCSVGAGEELTAVGGIIGVDVLGRSAVRLDIPARTLHFFPDVPGDDAARGRACEAVFPSPYFGGGTLFIAGSEVAYPAQRTAVGACLDESGAPTEAQRGIDGLFVLSTGLGPTLLAASTYDRYARLTGAPARADLPRSQVFLPSGPIDVRLGEVGRTALVGEASDERGPCRELYANRVLARDLCNDPEAEITDCPCPDEKRFCSTAAAVVLDAPIQVAVVPDDAPILQALRNELRPALPEVDGVLGVGALRDLRVELDYPNNRLLLRCEDKSACTTRPEVRSRSSLDALAACLEDS